MESFAKSSTTEDNGEMDPWDAAVLKEHERQKQKHKIGLLVHGEWRVELKVGFGTFGSIYSATSTSGKRVAVKFEYGSLPGDEEQELHKSHLTYENKVYESLRGGEGIPRLHWFGSEFGYNIMVLDLLGPNLEQLLQYCGYTFSLKTVLLLADQMLDRIEHVHNSGFIHRDIKPANFLIGTGPDANKLFLIDYGLAKRYRSVGSDNQLDSPVDHVNFRQGRSLVGTARYSSLNAHLGNELSRRDDLEALGYLLISFRSGSLPWQNLKAKTRTQKYNRIKKMKHDISMEKLCQGLPREFIDYMKYCRELEFQQKPDYEYLRGLIRNLMRKRHFEFDLSGYDWNLIARNPGKRETWEVLFKWTTAPPIVPQSGTLGPPQHNSQFGPLQNAHSVSPQTPSSLFTPQSASPAPHFAQPVVCSLGLASSDGSSASNSNSNPLTSSWSYSNTFSCNSSGRGPSEFPPQNPQNPNYNNFSPHFVQQAAISATSITGSGTNAITSISRYISPHNIALNSSPSRFDTHSSSPTSTAPQNQNQMNTFPSSQCVTMRGTGGTTASEDVDITPSSSNSGGTGSWVL